MSLAAPPEVRTSGSFEDDNRRLEWTQPSDCFQAQYHQAPGTLVVNGHSTPFAAYDLLVVRPGSHCEILRSEPATFVYSYFGFVPAKSDVDVMTIPMVSSLGEEGKWWDTNFRRALNQLMLRRTPVRALVHAWLWAVALPEQVSPRNPYVDAAERLFEERLDSDIQVSAIAKELHLSQSQLTRLFLAEHGRTPLQFLLERRAAKAHYLLTQTTLPIKSVAAACGVPNVHAFNRFVRARLGASPRSIRLGTAVVDVFRVADFGASRREASSH